MVHQLPLVGAIAGGALRGTAGDGARGRAVDHRHRFAPHRFGVFYSQSQGDHPAGIGWAFHDSNGYPDFGRVDALGEDQAREPAHLRNIAAKRYMVELINAERTRAGLASRRPRQQRQRPTPCRGGRWRIALHRALGTCTV